VGNNTQNQVILTREFSSGGIVFKKEKENVLWLIRKTSSSDLFPETHWMLPKGWLDDSGEGVPGPMASGKIKTDEKTLQKTAIREVAEEGGIEAEIVKKIETLKFFYTHPTRGRILKFVTFYLMKWVKDLSGGFDSETSEIAWLPFDEALERLSFRGEKLVFKKAKELL
jgi:8-oxo-dGTP pyrophosphatase MutT (NUDIX family)